MKKSRSSKGAAFVSGVARVLDIGATSDVSHLATRHRIPRPLVREVLKRDGQRVGADLSAVLRRGRRKAS